MFLFVAKMKLFILCSFVPTETDIRELPLSNYVTYFKPYFECENIINNETWAANHFQNRDMSVYLQEPHAKRRANEIVFSENQIYLKFYFRFKEQEQEQTCCNSFLCHRAARPWRAVGRGPPGRGPAFSKTHFAWVFFNLSFESLWCCIIIHYFLLSYIQLWCHKPPRRSMGMITLIKREQVKKSWTCTTKMDH